MGAFFLHSENKPQIPEPEMREGNFAQVGWVAGHGCSYAFPQITHFPWGLLTNYPCHSPMSAS